MMSITAVLEEGEDVQADLMCMSVVFTTVSKKPYLKNMLTRQELIVIFWVVN